MAGTINLSMSQQFDMDGEPLSGGLLYFFVAGTTTPQQPFQDFALTLPHPNPIVLDASGRVPSFYLADGFIKIRLTDNTGVTVIAADQLLVIGPSAGGGGGGGGVDQTSTLQTGDVKARYGTGALDGYVRCNGLTIGKAGSGATERAVDACQALFEYLWAFPNIALDIAKGSDAHTDWLAGRKLILPDLRGRAIVGMDDMGSTAASRLTAAFFGSSAIVLGNSGGNEKQTLTAAQLAAHTHTGTTAVASTDHTHAWGGTFTTTGEGANHQHGFITGGMSASHTHVQAGTFGTSGQTVDHSHNLPNLSLASFGGYAGGGGLGAITNVSYAGGTGGTPTSGTSNDHAHNVTIGGNTGAASADHTHSGTTGSENIAHGHDVTVGGATGGMSANHTHTITTNTGDGVSGAQHSVANPAMVMTIYMKM